MNEKGVRFDFYTGLDRQRISVLMTFLIALMLGCNENNNNTRKPNILYETKEKTNILDFKSTAQDGTLVVDMGNDDFVD